MNTTIGNEFMISENNQNNAFSSLKIKREALGLTLRDVFKLTRITVSNLEAIENGDLHLLPSPIYTRNFIKTYARAVGIESANILESYEDHLNSLRLMEITSLEDVPGENSFLDVISNYKAYLWIAGILFVIVLVAVLVSYQYRPASDVNSSLLGETAAIKTEGDVNAAGALPSTNTLVDEQPKDVLQTAANENSKTKQLSTPSGTRQENPIMGPSVKPRAQGATAITGSEEANLLIIKAIEETWIRIKIDQNPSIQFLLKPGDKIERMAASFDMDIGNAGGIKIQFKGKKIENLGKSGEVINLKMP